jgi:hypothetical protein
MNNNCDVVRDLLPLYLDDICSESSRKCVEDHIRECENCRNLLQELKTDLPKKSVNIPREDDVLKHTAWQMNKRAIKCAVGITSIVLYWLIYLWEEGLSSQGNYSYFSYQFHERYVFGFMLVPFLTVVWFISVLVQIIKSRTWCRNILLVVVLALLLYLQGVYIYQQYHVWSTTAWTEVVEIPDEYHVVIKNGDETVTLKTTPIVTSLLKTDGTEYGFDYEFSLRTPNQGKLNGIVPVSE